MKKLLIALALALGATGNAWADVKISSLPIGSAASSGSGDSFPFVSSSVNITKRMTIWDIVNIPTITATYAPKSSPTFTGTVHAFNILATGTVTAPTFVGALTGNASTATALAANPVDCSSGQYANAIAANGDLTCAAVSTSQLSGTLGVAGGGTGITSGTPGGLLAFTASTTAVSTAAGSSGQILRSAGTASPTWSTATYPATTTANQILYSSATNTIGGIATANSSALVTDSSGVPSFTSGSTANRVLRTNGTAVTFSQVAGATDISGQVPVANGGTGAATLTVHGVVIGNATSAVNITTAGTSGQVLTSNGPSADPTFQTSSSATITSWAAYTPTFQGFGTVTCTYCRWRQVGQNYEVEAKIVMGTVVASQAQMSLPNSGVTASSISSIGLFGYWTSASASGTAPTIIANGGNAYVNFGFSAGAAAGLTPQNGNDMISTGGTISIYFSVPIQGL